MRPGFVPRHEEECRVNETPDPAMLKLAGAALGGYVLGRFKKGRAAISFAMWMAGAKDPKRMLRDGLLSAAQTPEAQQLLSQLRGPALEAGRRVAAATFENQIGALTSALEQRTKAISAGVGDEDEDTGRKRRKKDRARADERPAEDEAEFDEDDEADTDEYEEEPEEDESDEEDEAEDAEADTDEYEEEPDEDEEDDDEQEAAAEAATERRRPRKAASSPAKKAAPPARKKAAPAAKKSAQPARKAAPPSDDEPPRKRARRSAPAGRAPRRNRTEGARS
jgi:hypothetical protein